MWQLSQEIQEILLKLIQSEIIHYDGRLNSNQDLPENKELYDPIVCNYVIYNKKPWQLNLP